MVAEPDPVKLGAMGDPIVKGNETIWELVTQEDGVGFGQALVRINGENEAHYHLGMREVYIVLWGGIEIDYGHVDNGPYWQDRRDVFSTGRSWEIAPQMIHQTRPALDWDHAWFYVLTFPAFDPNDYHVVETTT